jgi:hypothetical protein
MRISKLVFILLLFVVGCEKDKSTTEPENMDIYSYSAYDTTGTKIIQGWLEISVIDSSRIEGVWHLHKTANVGKVGPQTGDGKLIGNIYDGSISINLNPDVVDNNVILRGPVLNYVTEGEWSWTTIVGVTSKGTYKAIRDIPD